MLILLPTLRVSCGIRGGAFHPFPAVQCGNSENNFLILRHHAPPKSRALRPSPRTRRQQGAYYASRGASRDLLIDFLHLFEYRYLVAFR